MTLAIACSGGGNWCIAQLGFIHALQERGYETRAASGVSFGSLGAYGAVTGDPLGVLEKIRRFREVVDTDLLKVWQHRTSPWGLVQKLEEGLAKVLPATIEVPGDYFVMAVKLPSMKTVAFSKGDNLPQILRAAMAMPPLPAAKYNGQLLRDAGLRIKYGIKPLVAKGYEKILALGSFNDFFHMRWATWKRMFPNFKHVQTHEVVLSMVDKIGVAEFTTAGFPVMDAVFEEGYRAGKRISGHLLDSLVNRPTHQWAESSAMARTGGTRAGRMAGREIPAYSEYPLPMVA